MAISYTFDYHSPLGPIIMASDGTRLTGVWFEGQRYFGSTLQTEVIPLMIPIFAETITWLDCYFKGGQPDFLPPVQPEGSPFRRLVWQTLQQIPYGETISYGELATEIARQRGISHESARAVGGAVGHNPISLLIPCHRVVGKDGSLTGYAGGLSRKIALLTLEGTDTSRLRLPHSK